MFLFYSIVLILTIKVITISLFWPKTIFNGTLGTIFSRFETYHRLRGQLSSSISVHVSMLMGRWKCSRFPLPCLLPFGSSVVMYVKKWFDYIPQQSRRFLTLVKESNHSGAHLRHTFQEHSYIYPVTMSKQVLKVWYRLK